MIVGERYKWKSLEKEMTTRVRVVRKIFVGYFWLPFLPSKYAYSLVLNN